MKSFFYNPTPSVFEEYTRHVNHTMPTVSLKRSLAIALIFQIAWIALGIIAALSGTNVYWLLLVANLFTLWVPVFFTLVTRIQLSARFQVAFAAFISASSLIGSSLGGYASIPHWDTIVHFYSGVLLAWFGLILVVNAEKSIQHSLPHWFKNSVVLMTPVAFSAVWEVYEYMSDMLLGTSMQAGGLGDTVIDMLAGLLGAFVALIVSMLWAVKNKGNSLEK